MPYQLKYYPGVQRKLRTLPERIRRDVTAVILDLVNDPYPPTAEPLRDQYTGTLKIKVDGWRIFYRVDEQDQVIGIVNVKRRDRDTYRRLT
jgi:addiction module RelE/StbE family toxin